MEKKKKSSDKIRPIDVRPGDLLSNQASGPVTVLSSDLVEPGTRCPGGRVRKHEWWITYLYMVGDQPNRQTERYPARRFDEKCIQIIREPT